MFKWPIVHHRIGSTRNENIMTSYHVVSAANIIDGYVLILSCYIVKEIQECVLKGDTSIMMSCHINSLYDQYEVPIFVGDHYMEATGLLNINLNHDETNLIARMRA